MQTHNNRARARAHARAFFQNKTVYTRARTHWARRHRAVALEKSNERVSERKKKRDRSRNEYFVTCARARSGAYYNIMQLRARRRRRGDYATRAPSWKLKVKVFVSASLRCTFIMFSRNTTRKLKKREINFFTLWRTIDFNACRIFTF